MNIKSTTYFNNFRLQGGNDANWDDRRITLKRLD